MLYRPLLLTSVMPELGESRGVRSARIETLFLVVLALATSMALPVVGALLIFSLMIGPPAAARSFTDRPALAIGLSVVMALGTVWAAIAAHLPDELAGGLLRGDAERWLVRHRPDRRGLAPEPAAVGGRGARRARGA